LLWQKGLFGDSYRLNLKKVDHISFTLNHRQEPVIFYLERKRSCEEVLQEWKKNKPWATSQFSRTAFLKEQKAVE